MLTGINAMKKSSGTLSKVVVVLISDGRANIPLSESLNEGYDPGVVDVDKDPVDEEQEQNSSSRDRIKEEILALAKKLGSLKDFNLLCIDTENKYLSTGFSKEVRS
jgi:magnesium chelatase subunit D